MNDKKAANQAKTPDTQIVKVSPISGVAPPVEHQWRKGQSGNPKGKNLPAAWTLRSWLNAFSDWREDEIREVLADPDATVAQKAAAARWLDAASTERNAAGNPTGGAVLEMIADQTGGRPVQRSELTVTGDFASFDAGRLDAAELAQLTYLLAKATNQLTPAALPSPDQEGQS